MRPLTGITVLDFSTLLPGPYASLILAEAGARVIKIERPEGDDMRRFAPSLDEMSAPYAALNRGKDIVAIDLKDQAKRPDLIAMIRHSDILIEQFRPGVMARLGLGYDDIKVINPRLIYCSITGYGQTGPDSGLAGHDINYQARTGVLDQMLGAPDSSPLPPPLIADIAGGTYPAVINILLALRERDRTGQGCHLDIAMADGTLPFAWYALATGDAGEGDQKSYPRGGEGLLTGKSPRYALYPTRDGRFLAVGALEDKFWAVFCDTLALPARFRNDASNASATKALISSIIAGQNAAHWNAVFKPLDCCCTIVTTLEEALADPHFQQRNLRRTVAVTPDGARIPAAPTPLAPVFRDHAPDEADVGALPRREQRRPEKL
jgi:alpha-methylacyl-CoA racemase